MEPYDKIKARDQMTVLMNKSINVTCKNAKYELSDLGQDEEGKWKYGFKNEGCTYMRRNGSAYCQDCSDKYKLI